MGDIISKFDGRLPKGLDSTMEILPGISEGDSVYVMQKATGDVYEVRGEELIPFPIMMREVRPGFYRIGR